MSDFQYGVAARHPRGIQVTVVVPTEALALGYVEQYGPDLMPVRRARAIDPFEEYQ